MLTTQGFDLCYLYVNAFGFFENTQCHIWENQITFSFIYNSLNISDTVVKEETQISGDPAPPNTASAGNVTTDEMATGTEPTAEQPEVDPHAPSPDSAMYDKEATATG